MRHLGKFLRKPAADRRLLLSAAALHLFVAAGLRVLPFHWVRRVLNRLAASGAAAAGPGADARIVHAVRTAAFLLPGEHCLTEALVAQCLLARAGCESTLCFGLSPVRTDARPFDAHAWIEQKGRIAIGARAVAYQPLRRPRNLL